jgi:hypothetical protein
MIDVRLTMGDWHAGLRIHHSGSGMVRLDDSIYLRLIQAKDSARREG